MTRDEQIAAAERIARLNPEWVPTPFIPDLGLLRYVEVGGGEVFESHKEDGWVARSASRDRWIACTDIAAAIRALGFTINDGGENHG